MAGIQHLSMRGWGKKEEMPFSLVLYVPIFSHTLCPIKKGAWNHQVWTLRSLSFVLLPPDRLLCSGHDVSDGGLITCLLEMAFAGNCGIEVDVSAPGVDGEEPRV